LVEIDETFLEEDDVLGFGVLAVVGETDSFVGKEGFETLVLVFEIIDDFLLKNVCALIISNFEVADMIFRVILIEDSGLILCNFFSKDLDLLLVNKIIFGLIVMSGFNFDALEIVLELFNFVVFGFYESLELG
jgi:hypothetical protein